MSNFSRTSCAAYCHEFGTGAWVGEMAHVDFLEPPITSIPNDCLGGAIESG